MKKIFDWLRKETQEEIMPKGSVSKTEMLIKSSCYWKVLALIDEAEAKWGGHDSPCEYQNEDIRVDEPDCCEWKKVYDDYVDSRYTQPCDYARTVTITRGFDFIYCPYCGKRIKITEV